MLVHLLHVLLSCTLMGWALWYPSYLTLPLFALGLLGLYLPRHATLALSPLMLVYSLCIFTVEYIYCMQHADVEVPFSRVLFFSPFLFPFLFPSVSPL